MINFADGRKEGLSEKMSPAVMEGISSIEIIGI
jgi:hypothetical protein